MHLPVATGRQVPVVGDQQQRSPHPLTQREQQIDDRLAGRVVQIPGRFVGQQQGRFGREGSGERGALLLSAGQLAGEGWVRRWLRPGRAPGRLPRRASAFRTPASSSGIATFSSAVIVGIRWNAWNTIPTRSRRSFASASSFSRVISCPSSETLPDVARSSPASTISRLVFPEPDGPTKPTASPLAMSRSTPRNMLTGPTADGTVRCRSIIHRQQS